MLIIIIIIIIIIINVIIIIIIIIIIIYEKVKIFKYLGSLLTNQNNIQEESRLRVYENRILRWIFGPKK